MSKKHFSDTVGNRIRDLPACSPVREPIALPRGPPPTICSMEGEKSYFFPMLLFSDEHFFISWFLICSRLSFR